MAIDGITGIPGSGKSHGAVLRVLLPALRSGRTVVHNMPLNDDELLSLASDGGKHSVRGKLVKLPEDINAATLVATFPPGAVLLLDEAWRFWPSGMKASAIPENQREFFAMHRHLVGADGNSTDIFLVCQDLNQIATFIRDLVDQTFRYVKQTIIGKPNRYRCDVYQGPVTGPRPPAAKLTSSYHGKYDPMVYACYQSHTKSVTGEAGTEEKLDKRGTIFGRWGVKAAFFAVVLIPVLVWFAIKSFWAVVPKAKDTAPGLPSIGKSVAVSEHVPAKLTVVPAARPVQDSKTWRLAGQITRRGRVVWIVASSGGSKFLDRSACNEDGGGNVTCMIDGEMVAEWTGSRELNPVSAFVTTAATPLSIP